MPNPNFIRAITLILIFASIFWMSKGGSYLGLGLIFIGSMMLCISTFLRGKLLGKVCYFGGGSLLVISLVWVISIIV